MFFRILKGGVSELGSNPVTLTGGAGPTPGPAPLDRLRGADDFPTWVVLSGQAMMIGSPCGTRDLSGLCVGWLGPGRRQGTS